MTVSVTVMRPTEIKIKHIRCILPVRYGEEDMPEDYPFRKGDVWDITIAVENGQIENWPSGIPGIDLYMKVVDQGIYILLGEDGSELAKIDGDYVPSCIPQRYGDYVDFEIDDNGKIKNWSSVKFRTQVVSDGFKWK